MNEIFSKYPEKICLFNNLKGEIGVFSKRISKHVNSPIAASPYQYIEDEKEGNFTERTKLYRLNSLISDSGATIQRDIKRKNTFTNCD